MKKEEQIPSVFKRRVIKESAKQPHFIIVKNNLLTL